MIHRSIGIAYVYRMQHNWTIAFYAACLARHSCSVLGRTSNHCHCWIA